MRTGVNYNVWLLRKAYHVTQAQLAEYLGLKRTTLAHIEAYGTFKPDQLQKISTFFGITTDDLINGTFDLPNNPAPKPVEPLLNTNRQNTVLPLTPREINLIEMFRKLDPDRKNEISCEIMEG